MNTDISKEQAEELAGIGWKLVPVEPTDRMLGAGLRWFDCMGNMPRAWKDMLSAAPPTHSTPAQQSVREVFEAAIVKDAPVSIAREGSGYADSYVNAAWWGWQAALSTSPLLDKNDQPEGEIDRLIDQRDNAEEWADRLANAIAQHFDVDIGEHSNLNNPWNEALTTIESPPQPDSNELVELRRDADRLRNQRNELHKAIKQILLEPQETMSNGKALSAIIKIAKLIDARIDAALAQSPSVGLNTKKGG